MGIVTTALRETYDLAFQISPIILKGGLFADAGMMPIVALTGQLASLTQGILSGGINENDFYARFVPLSGATVINNAVGMYPYANQQVAGNAIVNQPLTISMLMIAPVKDTGGYLTKLAIFTALRNSLKSHQDAGGTFNVATPSFIFNDCLLVGMIDVTHGDSKQQQIMWQLDFIKPLITLADASIAYNGLINILVGGKQTSSSSWSGVNSVIASSVGQIASNAGNMGAVISNFLSAPI